jgi:hypothetical protein
MRAAEPHRSGGLPRLFDEFHVLRLQPVPRLCRVSKSMLAMLNRGDGVGSGDPSQRRVVQRQALGEISHQRSVGSCQHVDVDSLDDLRDAAVEWAAGGRGRPLVDAVVNALVAGADTPALVLLAGATRALADEEAAEFAPRMFDELGLVVHERHSEAAYLAAARLEARRFLEKGGSGRSLAGRPDCCNACQVYINASVVGYTRATLVVKIRCFVSAIVPPRDVQLVVSTFCLLDRPAGNSSTSRPTGALR